MQLPYRTLLRRTVTERLRELAAFQRHVYDSRMPPLTREILPAVRITTPSAQRANRARGHDIGEFEAAVTLRLQVTCEHNDEDPAAMERLDWLCEIAETALLADIAVRKVIRRVDAMATTIDIDDQGELRTAIATTDITVISAECFELEFPDQLKRIRVRFDFIDPPADPNTGPPGTPPNVPGGYPGGYPGPDGRFELGAEWIIAQDDA
ncbi:MAG: hypothetical protein FWD12_04395 [Alphaproteobacteria bacterium]|nr:hypothetical protein [Alphaproteobacteria bacterium]